MFCKYCGSVIADPASGVCGKCGRRQSASGGTGFWDVLERRPDSAEKTERPAYDAVPVRPEEPARREKPAEKAEVSKKTDRSHVVCLLICALCLVAVASVLFRGSALKRRVEQLEKAASQTETDISAIRSRTAQLEEFRAAEEKKNAETPAMPVATPQPLRIEKEPTSETDMTRPADGKPKVIFTVETNVAPEDFIWQKKDPQGSWTDIELDEDGTNPEYGIAVQSSGERSKLCCTDYPDEAQGTYRCIVIAKDGTRLKSDEAILSFADEADD